MWGGGGRGWESVSTGREGEISPTSGCRWLADALVRVDVALAVGAGVHHILEVVDQAGNQAAAHVAPEEESADRRLAAVVRCSSTSASGCVLSPTHPTKKQKRQNSVFMSPTWWEMQVTMACWQCGHTVCTGDVWNISPCSTVTVVVPAWPPMWTNWPGVGPIGPAIGWGKWPGGGGYIPPVDQRRAHIQNLGANL